MGQHSYSTCRENCLRDGTFLLVEGGVESIGEFSPDGAENVSCGFSGVSRFLVRCCRGDNALTCTKAATSSPSQGGLQHPAMLRLSLKATLYPPKAVPPRSDRVSQDAMLH